jgi:2-polyprenyl-3-methyl-5-hydroxy-6-metoxy-1,4-benzoquinol methylase
MHNREAMGREALDQERRNWEELPRWELYRALSEPIRLKLLALAERERLSIGELAEVLAEGQPNISRHVAVLKQAAVAGVEKEGTRTFVTVSDRLRQDPIMRDAFESGRKLCEEDGSLRRLQTVLAARDQAGRDYFAKASDAAGASGPLSQLAGPYLGALGWLLPKRGLAVDVGTGDGSLLELLAPMFQRVVGIDRSEAQLALARKRMASASNVELSSADVSELPHLHGRADVVVASRFLHHAAKPLQTLTDLGALLAPDGRLVIIDYARHEDESMRERADLWLGFDERELLTLAQRAGFAQATVSPIRSPEASYDSHLAWQALIAQNFARPASVLPKRSGASANTAH